MSRPVAIFKTWLPFAVTITALCALCYVTAQQVLRQDANDPQIQMAEDTAAALDHGKRTGDLLPTGQVEISSSLAPFLMVFDADGKSVDSSGLLDGNVPDYPIGALQSAKQTSENRVTWQPQAGVRIASVVVPYKAGYVVAGRSLREVENRESQAQLLAAVAWIISLVAVLVVVALEEYVLSRK